MASDQYQSLFQCVGCQSQLNKRSKTLQCLHSVCNSCFRNTLGDGESEGKCPECGVGFHNYKRLTLSPILTNELIRQRCKSPEWQCDSCMEEGISSVSKNWCITCDKLFCTNCMRLHNKFTEEHTSMNLDEIKRVDAIEMMMRKKCLLHGEAVELFCETCNTCLCNTCYNRHLTSPINSNCMNVHPLVLKEEASKGKTQVLNMEKEMVEFEEILKSSNVNLLKYTDELNLECEFKCQEIWMKYEQIEENARLDALDLCKKMRQETAEEVKKWHNILGKNTRTLKELEIWLLNLHHLLREDHDDKEIFCGIKLLASRLPSRHHNWMKPTEKCELHFTLPDWWHQAMEPLANRQIASVSRVKKTIPVKKLIKQNQWIMPGSKSRSIRTIQIAEKDDHIFICDQKNRSIIEISESGQYVNEFLFCDEENQNFKPLDMCSISPDQFVVCGQNKLIFLERIKIQPFLQIQKIVQTKKKMYSLCLKDETIFNCDYDFGIHSFTKEGVEIKAIKLEVEGESRCTPRIRVDFSSGNFLVSRWDISEMISFNSEGETLDSFQKVNRFFDFSFTEFGKFYCNFQGIFSFCSQKLLYRFEKKFNESAKLFVFQNKMFICFEEDGKLTIEVFKIFY